MKKLIALFLCLMLVLPVAAALADDMTTEITLWTFPVGGFGDDEQVQTLIAENTCGIAGLRAAVETYPADGYEHMLRLKQLLVSLLREKLPETTVLGFPAEDDRSAGHVLSVAFPPVRAETLLHALEGDGIYVGTGSACSSKKGKHSAVLTAMKTPNAVMDGAIRISLCPENTEEEMRFTAEMIKEHVELVRRFARR